jgi:hypothetical protein
MERHADEEVVQGAAAILRHCYQMRGRHTLCSPSCLGIENHVRLRCVPRDPSCPQLLANHSAFRAVHLIALCMFHYIRLCMVLRRGGRFLLQRIHHPNGHAITCYPCIV